MVNLKVRAREREQLKQTEPCSLMHALFGQPSTTLVSMKGTRRLQGNRAAGHKKQTFYPKNSNLTQCIERVLNNSGGIKNAYITFFSVQKLGQQIAGNVQYNIYARKWPLTSDVKEVYITSRCLTFAPALLMCAF